MLRREAAEGKRRRPIPLPGTPPVPRENPGGLHRKGPLLLVEDEVIVREVLEQVLTDEGYEVLTAGDGRQALERLQQERPALMLLDLMMPIMDGHEVLAWLRRRAPDLPVVITTGMQVSRSMLRGANVVQVMRKPLSLEALLQAVDMHVPR
ncbi:MAG: response regulator [Planctomycetes bacterium]|nr:response regulator [Planctomycetota bacterium]